MLPLYLMLAMAPQAPPATCSMNAAGFCTGRVVHYALDNADPYPVIHINVALGKSTLIELAGDGMAYVGEPVVSNTRLLDGSGTEDHSRIIIHPLPPFEGRNSDATAEALIDLRANMQIELTGGVHIIVEVRFGEEQEAVERLVIDFPERQRESRYVREMLAEREARMRQDDAENKNSFKQQVRDQADTQMTQDILNRFQCRDLRARTMRDLVALEATRICRIGNRVHVAFKVKNRSRMLFALDSVSLAEPGGNAATAARVEYSSGTQTPFIVFNGEEQGVAMIPVSATGTGPNVFTLSVRESGGRGRQVTLEDVGL